MVSQALTLVSFSSETVIYPFVFNSFPSLNFADRRQLKNKELFISWRDATWKRPTINNVRALKS